jgi:CheY-like chemotaxis protein
MPKNVVLETDLQSLGPVVLANAKQLRQIFTNLVTNAWESAEENRPLVIRLTTRTVPAAAIPPAHRFPIAWQPETGAYACLEVQDNGCGISETDLQELFAPFFSTKFTGRGLGLPMVLGLVQAHSGVVTVESTPGQGSVFRVFLPVTAEKEGVQRAGAAISTMADRPAGKILLVDDDEIIVDITSMMLVRLGFTVLSAGDGIEAVEMYRQHRPELCLVLSDVYMPKMNGWETLSALRRIDPDIPVILISGYSEEQVMEGDHPDIPQAFLGKPYSFEVLKDAIRRALKDTSGYESYRGVFDQTGA